MNCHQIQSERLAKLDRRLAAIATAKNFILSRSGDELKAITGLPPTAQKQWMEDKINSLMFDYTTIDFYMNGMDNDHP